MSAILCVLLPGRKRVFGFEGKKPSTITRGPDPSYRLTCGKSIDFS